MGQGRSFSREFKLEAVKLVGDRGVPIAQAARDLDIHENVLRKWMRQQPTNPKSAFPGHGQMKPEQKEIERLLADQGIMSRVGNVWDNAAVESSFSSLKTERVSRKIYRTQDEARADVFNYIERFYNPHRRHSTLGYESPLAFVVKTQFA